MRLKNKIYIVLSAIILILVVSNPTRKDFVEYLGQKKDSDMKNLSRKNNFIIFSIFINDDTENEQNYLAICKNFIKIK